MKLEEIVVFSMFMSIVFLPRVLKRENEEGPMDLFNFLPGI